MSLWCWRLRGAQDAFRRLSGASGKVPAAIYSCPDALNDRPRGRPCDGDVIKIFGQDSIIEAKAAKLNAREPAKAPPPATGTGRELFAFMRATADDAEHGESAMLHAMEEML